VTLGVDLLPRWNATKSDTFDFLGEVKADCWRGRLPPLTTYRVSYLLYTTFVLSPASPHQSLYSYLLIVVASWKVSGGVNTMDCGPDWACADTRSDTSELTVLSRSPSPATDYETQAGNTMDCGSDWACSDTWSDTSELTVLSRSPSPVTDYETQVGYSSVSSTNTSCVSIRPRRENGRFMSRKRARTPERYVIC
jgi:hypothetical protein